MKRPGIYDLIQHAEVGGAKRQVLEKYVPEDYDQTIRQCRRFGAPIVKRLAMRIGRSAPHYHLDPQRSRLEAVTDFAFERTIKNEQGHRAALAFTIEGGVFIEGLMVNVGGSHVLEAGAAAMTLGYSVLQAGIIGLQRYNRARLLRMADMLLAKEGPEGTFSARYVSSYGVDARAVAAFYEAQQGNVPASPFADSQPSSYILE